MNALETRATLLIRLRDASDQDAWRLFASIYTHFDYDPHRGSFRGWLLTLVRNSLRKRYHQSKHQAIGSGDTDVQIMLQQSPDPNAHSDSDWEREYEL